MRVAFVFVSYNNTKYTKDLVDSIKGMQGNEHYRIIIVDNNSCEGEKQALHDLISMQVNIEIMYSETNAGYFPGLNIGLKMLSQTNVDYDAIIIGNNDLIFPNQFLTQLKNKQYLLNKYSVIAPSIVDLDGNHQNPHVIKRVSKFREYIYDLYYSSFYLSRLIAKVSSLTRCVSDRSDESQFDKPQEIYQGFGACYILSKGFISKYKQLSMPCFMYHEELFLAHQLKEGGESIWYEPTIVVKHVGKASTGAMQSLHRWRVARDAHIESRKIIPTRLWKWLNFKRNNE